MLILFHVVFFFKVFTYWTLYVNSVCKWDFMWIHVPLFWKYIFSLVQQTALLVPPTAMDIRCLSHCSLWEVVPKLPPPHQATNPYLSLSLIRQERWVIHADHSTLHHLEGRLWGTHSCFSASLIEPHRLLMGEAQVTPDSLASLLVLKMGLWCRYWRSSWLRIAHVIRRPSFIYVYNILTMNQGLANLSMAAWPWIKSQIIKLLPYVGLTALENWDGLFFPCSQYASTLFTLCHQCVHFSSSGICLCLFSHLQLRWFSFLRRTSVCGWWCVCTLLEASYPLCQTGGLRVDEESKASSLLFEIPH